jgi:hypothetical protein
MIGTIDDNPFRYTMDELLSKKKRMIIENNKEQWLHPFFPSLCGAINSTRSLSNSPTGMGIPGYTPSLTAPWLSQAVNVE